MFGAGPTNISDNRIFFNFLFSVGRHILSADWLMVDATFAA